jgi:FtsZ-interacting cell division protein ZipA
MSDLQISLLAIGAVVIAAVYAFNVWQERQLRRRTEEAFARDHPDVLLGGAGNGADNERRVEPTINTEMPAAVLVAATVATSACAIDPVIDFVVEVNLPEPTAGAGLRDELTAAMAATGKSVLAEGYAAASGDWVDAAGSQQFQRLRFALQMSNRAGCVTQNHLSAFRDVIAEWAEARHGEIKSLDLEAAHAMAAQLDRFCADVDIAIGVNVISNDGNPFTGVRIRELAEQNTLRLEPDGVFYARAADGAVLFTLDNHEPMPFVPEQMRSLHTSGVTFLLDVPRVATALDALDAMVGSARTFAGELGGRLVDDNRAPLSDSAIAAIRKQLEGILAKMEAGRIPAGGARALRLFA